MASKLNTPELIDNSEFKPKWENKVRAAEWCMLAAFLVFTFLFCIHQPWFKWSDTIDNEKWGTYGDFIGGLLGTFLAYISLRLLIKTLKEQEKSNTYLKESNDRNSEVAELQLVHEDVNTLLDSYHRTVSSFVLDDKKGEEVLSMIADEMYTSFSNTDESLSNRIDESRKLFETEYIKRRDTMAVYYRLLYQVFQVIWLSDVDGRKKAMLSKMIRSQFTEDELLLLRYNCLTDNGYKMRTYINQFNLLKHLPLTHLLEFKKWVSDLSEVQKNRLDTECVALRKCIKNLLIADNNKEEVHHLNYSDKYKGLMKISADKKEFYFEIVRYTKVKSSTDETSMDKVLDNWDDNKIKSFFIDFFSYVFDYSNFSRFNKVGDLQISHDIKTEDNGKKHTVWTLVKKNNSCLVVSMPQDVDPKK